MRNSVLCLLILTCLTACSTTTVYVVRHAEKVSETDSTDLSPAGFRRAAALADKLGNESIDSIFTTPYRRTRQTAEPLAKRLSVPMRDYPAKPISAITQRINAIKGKTVLVVGHSNTILEIVKGLDAQPSLTKIGSDDFDNLFQVRIKRKPFSTSVKLTELTYGEPTK
jgi:broad specificity phosphatase PhoE